MSAHESEAAVTRIAVKRKELGPDDFAAYAFLVLGILGYHSPEVLDFVFDRADAMLADGAA